MTFEAKEDLVVEEFVRSASIVRLCYEEEEGGTKDLRDKLSCLERVHEMVKSTQAKLCDGHFDELTCSSTLEMEQQWQKYNKSTAKVADYISSVLSAYYISLKAHE